jgi:hypothetical protein
MTILPLLKHAEQQQRGDSKLCKTVLEGGKICYVKSVPVFARACHACIARQSCERQPCVRPDTSARQAYARHVV